MCKSAFSSFAKPVDMACVYQVESLSGFGGRAKSDLGGLGMSRRIRILAVAVISAALLTAGLATSTPAQAHHVCYPALCAAGEAAVTGLFCPTPIEHRSRNTCTVDVTNNGAPSFVHIDLFMKNTGSRKPPPRSTFRGKVVIPKSGFDIFLDADASTTVIFSVRARKPNRTALITACATATPLDLNTANDCLSTSRPTDVK
jgi:hypothetical protein